MIEVKNLQKSFGEYPVLKNISLHAVNETIGLLGANGSGKTTMLKCLLGIHNFKGEVRIGGFDVRKDPLSARRLIGYIPQSFPSFGELNVAESLSVFAKLRGATKQRESELLREFSLEEHAQKKVQQLSGGLKQKLSIAVALLSDPKVIFLDEPTANLDTWAIRDILKILKNFMQQKTVILSSHRIEEVLAVSHRLVQIKDGILVEPDVDALRIQQDVMR